VALLFATINSNLVKAILNSTSLKRYFIIFLFMCGTGVEPSPLLQSHLLADFTWMVDGDECGAVRGMNEWQKKSEYSKKTCLNTALITTDPS
jgi:hypothetical protein